MPTDTGPAVRIRNLSYRYPGYNTAPSVALDSINFDIRYGEKVLVSGASGSGKSSLLRCINGIIPNSGRRGSEFSGEVFVAGMNTRSHSIAEISGTVGTVFQNPDQQIVTNSVKSEIAFGLENICTPTEEIGNRIGNITELMHIENLLDRETSDLSWGEKQKVAIASVLVMEPKIVVMDEPFSGLDPRSAASLGELLNTLNRRFNLTIVLAEHRTEQVSGLVGRVVKLEKGRITYDGPPEGTGSVPISKGTDYPFVRPAPSGRKEGFTPAIELAGASYTYPGSPSPAIDNISIAFYDSAITVLLGSNGSGKSTLSKHLNGILRPDSGRVCLFGEEVTEQGKESVTKKVGLVSQHADHQLFEESISGEFSFGPANIGVPEEEINRRVPKVLSALDLGHIDLNTPPLRLSAGEKQRIAIGSILVMETPVIVLDEPTLGLDNRLKDALAAELRRRAMKGGCIIVMTHDLEFASTLRPERVLVMENGRISRDSDKTGG
ncbi:ABC transporter related protein [Methanolacinia petrolearia DSM 11571]|uniref:ABC transporter related protein n=1 Tax=Methanolacinia petrolearia (strain DSM 11571 / OCM 486 / SEBR 4847) TaxID=679926 RepID=E1RDM5_METP4|nr:ABC transporter ATP-binding protein [Methanolacinia petrolearia]ADN35978.1 ABC transporter related protein [Methanolacinia petrolearia DSM 11571]